jgi:hypothetical protein
MGSYFSSYNSIVYFLSPHWNSWYCFQDSSKFTSAATWPQSDECWNQFPLWPPCLRRQLHIHRCLRWKVSKFWSTLSTGKPFYQRAPNHVLFTCQFQSCSMFGSKALDRPSQFYSTRIDIEDFHRKWGWNWFANEWRSSDCHLRFRLQKLRRKTKFTRNSGLSSENLKAVLPHPVYALDCVFL